MEVLLRILWELLEEQGKECVNILAGSYCVADGAATVGETHVDRLVKENDRCVAVPRIWIVLQLKLLVDRRWSKLHEETSQGGAAGAAIKPEDDRIVLGIVSGFKEP